MPEDRDSLVNLIAANKSYEQKFDKSDLDAKPVKRISILTCMDCRMNPYEFAGLKEGEAHIIRNAGGRATDDAIRSLVISHKFLGTLDWFVIHHTQCGMATLNDEIIGELLEGDLETSIFEDGVWKNPDRVTSDNTKAGSDAGKSIHWHTISDLQESVSGDMEKIKSHPLVPSHINIYGFIFDVKTGSLIPVK